MVHLVIEFVTIVTTYSNTLGPHAPYLLSTVVVQQKIITSFITKIHISTHSIPKLININLNTTCKTVQTCDTSVFQQERVSFHFALFPHKIFSICCLVCFLIKAINIPYKENYAFNKSNIKHYSSGTRIREPKKILILKNEMQKVK